MLFSPERLHQLPYVIAALLPALTFHEWGHAFMATRFGDNTPRQMGRLTLNPLAHLDPLGTLVMFLANFGWAKPVPINPNNFRHSWAEFWVASAGPIMNLILATVAAMALRFGVYEVAQGQYATQIMMFLQIFIFMNLALAVFNLIPIGPLDGSHLLKRLLPLRASIAFDQWNTRVGGMLLFGIIIAESFLPIGIIRPTIRFGVGLLSSILL